MQRQRQNGYKERINAIIMNVNSVINADGVFLPAGADSSTSTVNNYFSDYINQQNSGSYLEQIFQKASDTYQVSKDLLKAMAKAESNFRADATSHCGAMGIMQLMPATAASLGVSDAYNPEQNIMGGAKYISQLLEKYNGNLAFAVAAYNAGSGNVDKYGGIPPFKETHPKRNDPRQRFPGSRLSFLCRAVPKYLCRRLAVCTGRCNRQCVAEYFKPIF